MADDYTYIVAQSPIPAADVSLLEFLLLSQILTVETEGGGHYLHSESGLNNLLWVTPAALREAYRDSVGCTSQVASTVADWLDKCDDGDPQVEQEFDLDARLVEQAFAMILQDVVRRSQTLTHLAVVGVRTCSRMLSDGFGGWACLITADAIEWMSTDHWIEDRLAALGSKRHGVSTALAGSTTLKTKEGTARLNPAQRSMIWAGPSSIPSMEKHRKTISTGR